MGDCHVEEESTGRFNACLILSLGGGGRLSVQVNGADSAMDTGGREQVKLLFYCHYYSYFIIIILAVTPPSVPVVRSSRERNRER